MPRKEIMEMMNNLSNRIYEVEVKIDALARQLHDDNANGIEDLNTAVAEMADVLYGGEE